VSKGWWFWLRRAQVTSDIELLLEALVPIARPYPFLNSDVPDHSGGLHA
jgi:hypothetical protein